MQPIPFFKLQAKNLYKDYKTQYTYIDENDGESYYGYSPKYFDIDELFISYDYNDDSFSLMKAQYFIASLLGFDKWSDLINASEKEQELVILLFKNKMDIEEWKSYVREIEVDNNVTFEFDSQIDFIKNEFIGRDSIFNVSNPFLIHNF